MIPLNTSHRLPAAAFWYAAYPAIIVSFIAVGVGGFMKDFIAATCATTVCPSFAPYIMPVLVILFVVSVLAQPVLEYILFSFSLADHAITINSGIIFRQYETIDYNRIQTIDLERGPILWFFGLTEVRLWTASADQFNNDESRTTRADTSFVLQSDTAEQLKSFIADARHTPRGTV